jgi:uncharacterized protein YcaQ
MTGRTTHTTTIPLQQARLIQLAALGLLKRPVRRPKPADLLSAIERMQLLQIDTIHVVARSPYFVLFSRIGAYPAHWLDELLESGAIFEAWSHEACFVPSRDFALHRSLRDVGGRALHWSFKHALRVQSSHRSGMDRLLDHIRTYGPVKASQFERSEPANSGWWGWKDEKRWLEALFALGELMIARRERFQRVYDLSERVIERLLGYDSAARTPQDLAGELILRSARALGISQARWIADYYRTGKRHKDADLQRFVASGELLPVHVETWGATAYVHRDNAELLAQAREGRLRATHTTLLSPFDPLVWDRERARAMFDFDYTIECYTPQPKRRYGYFVLPILHRGKLIGRVDAKAHRSDKMFEIKAIYLEPSVVISDALTAALAKALRECAAWHDTPKIHVRRSEPTALAKALERLLA